MNTAKKKSIQLRIRFNLRSKANLDRDGNALIIMICRYDKKRMVISTRENVKASHWDTKAGKARITRHHPEHGKLNERLATLEKLARSVYADNGREKLRPAKFRELIEDEKNWKKSRTPEEKARKPKRLLEFIDSYVKERMEAPDANRPTWKRLLTTRNKLHTYASERNPDLDFEHIDWEFLSDFKNWMFSEPRKYSINYASKLVEVVRQFMYEAVRRGITKNQVFAQKGWSIPKEKVKKVVLSLEELSRIAALDLSDREGYERARDLFLVGCYTGLRYSDFVPYTVSAHR